MTPLDHHHIPALNMSGADKSPLLSCSIMLSLRSGERVSGDDWVLARIRRRRSVDSRRPPNSGGVGNHVAH